MAMHREIIDGFEKNFYQNAKIAGEILAAYDENKTVECTDLKPILIKDYFQQLFERFKPSLIEHYICALLWQKILHEDLSYRIQETPECYPDNEIKNNDDLVKSYITNVEGGNIKEAAFWGGNKDNDGFIRFNNPPINNGTFFPLEIGYCRVTQFYYNLLQNGAIARLPYNKEYIIYFELKKPLFTL